MSWRKILAWLWFALLAGLTIWAVGLSALVVIVVFGILVITTGAALAEICSS